LRQKLDAGTSGVLACSARKRGYREQLRNGLESVRFFYLKIEYEVVARSPGATNGTLALLEEPHPNEAFIVDQNRPLADVVQEVLYHVGTLGLKPT
jgi:gluconate kinase